MLARACLLRSRSRSQCPPSARDALSKCLHDEEVRFQAGFKLQACMRFWLVHSRILSAKVGQGIALVQVILQATSFNVVVASHGPRNLFLVIPHATITGVAMVRVVEVNISASIHLTFWPQACARCQQTRFFKCMGTAYHKSTSSSMSSWNTLIQPMVCRESLRRLGA